jgi:hypothetical protein
MATRDKKRRRVVLTQMEVGLCARLGITIEDYARAVIEDCRAQERARKRARDKRLVQATAKKLAEATKRASSYGHA